MSMIPTDKRSSLFAGMWKARSKKKFYTNDDDSRCRCDEKRYEALKASEDN